MYPTKHDIRCNYSSHKCNSGSAGSISLKQLYFNNNFDAVVTHDECRNDHQVVLLPEQTCCNLHSIHKCNTTHTTREDFTCTNCQPGEWPGQLTVEYDKQKQSTFVHPKIGENKELVFMLPQNERLIFVPPEKELVSVPSEYVKMVLMPPESFISNKSHQPHGLNHMDYVTITKQNSEPQQCAESFQL